MVLCVSFSLHETKESFVDIISLDKYEIKVLRTVFINNFYNYQNIVFQSLFTFVQVKSVLNGGRPTINLHSALYLKLFS
jgi:hypothetical protein